MKNDKLWQMETMNCVLNLLCHMCCAMHESWWREVNGGRMKWLYGSICNAIKWTLNMHNNPLLSLSICLSSLSLTHFLSLLHTRGMSWIAAKPLFPCCYRTNFIFFCSLALFHFWANLKPCKKVYFIIHFHSNSNHNVCFIYVKAYSSLYSSTASCRWRIFTKNI